MLSRRTLIASLLVFSLAPIASRTAESAELPNLNGRAIVVVTENAYPPLQFVDPKTGKAIAGI